MSTRFKVSIKCLACGHRYQRVMRAADSYELETIPDPPCPCCQRAGRIPAFNFESGKAPAAIGSMLAKAVDMTADIVMQDHGMTDLRDNVREGETATPKLPPKLQAAADSMFSGPKNRRRLAHAEAMAGHPSGGIFGMPTGAILKAAVSGRFMTPDTAQPVATQHMKRDRAPIHIVAGDGVKPS